MVARTPRAINAPIPWTWHTPPLECIDPSSGMYVPAAATWRGPDGNVWALRWDSDAAGHGRNDPEFNPDNLHALVVVEVDDA